MSPTHQVLGLIPPTPQIHCPPFTAGRTEGRVGLGCPWALGHYASALETGNGLEAGTDHDSADAQRHPGGWGCTCHGLAPQSLCTEAARLVHTHQPAGQNGPVPLGSSCDHGWCQMSLLSWSPKRADEAEQGQQTVVFCWHQNLLSSEHCPQRTGAQIGLHRV